jgi:hypothetical protein
MSLIAPRTSGGGIIPALLYDDANAKIAALGAASVQITPPATCTVVTFTASGNCWIKVGTVASPPTAAAGVAGNDYLSAGTKWTRMVNAPCIIAVIQDGASTGSLAVLPAVDV